MDFQINIIVSNYLAESLKGEIEYFRGRQGGRMIWSEHHQN